MTELILIPLWSLNHESVLSHRQRFLLVSVFCYIYTRQYFCLASAVVFSARSVSSVSPRFHMSFPLKTIILNLVMTLFLSTPSFILHFWPSCGSAGLTENTNLFNHSWLRIDDGKLLFLSSGRSFLSFLI